MTAVSRKLNKFASSILLLMITLSPLRGWALAVTPDIIELEINAQPVSVTLLPALGDDKLIYKLRPTAEDTWDKSVKLEITVDKVRKETLSLESPYLFLEFPEKHPVTLNITAQSDAALGDKELRARLWGDSGQHPLLLRVKPSSKTPEPVKKEEIYCKNNSFYHESGAEEGFYLTEFESTSSVQLCNDYGFPVKLLYNFYQLEFDKDGKLLNRQTINDKDFKVSTDALAIGKKDTIRITPQQQHDYFVMTVDFINAEGNVSKLVGQHIFAFTKKAKTIPDYQITAASYRKIPYSVWLDLELQNTGELPMTAKIDLILRNTKGISVIRGEMEKDKPLILPQQKSVFSLEFPGYEEYSYQPLTAEIYITLNGKYQRKHRYAIKID